MTAMIEGFFGSKILNFGDSFGVGKILHVFS